MSFIEFVFAGMSLLLAISLSKALEAIYESMLSPNRFWPILLWLLSVSGAVLVHFMSLYAVAQETDPSQWTFRTALLLLLVAVFTYLQIYAFTFSIAAIFCLWSAYASLAGEVVLSAEFVMAGTSSALLVVGMLTRNIVFHTTLPSLFLISNVGGLATVILDL